jgi:adenylate kinase
MRVVLMGMPGVGKGTQASRLRERLGVVHVSTGDLLREAVRERSPLGLEVRRYLDAGDLVPDGLMGELIDERLGRPDAAEGFVLDGFPRTLEQVSVLDRVVERLGVALDRVILLRAPAEEVVHRLSGRRVCPGCDAVYHLESRRPAAAGVCDTCGSALAQRPDDAEAVIRERLRVYRQQTEPVSAAYLGRSLLREVDATGTPDEVWSRVLAAAHGS